MMKAWGLVLPSGEVVHVKKVIVVLMLGLLLVPGCHRIARKLGLGKQPTTSPAAATTPRP